MRLGVVGLVVIQEKAEERRHLEAFRATTGRQRRHGHPPHETDMHIHLPPPPPHELLSARPPSARALPGRALPGREIPLPSSSMCGGYGGDRSCSSVTAISKVLRLSGYNSSPGQRPPSLWPPTRLFPAARAAASRRPGSSTRRCRHHMGRRRRGGVLAG
jgi:hypothetical protein